MKWIKEYKETLIGIGVALFSAFVYISSLSIKDLGLTGSVNAASVPQWVCYALWALSVIQILKDQLDHRKKKDDSSKKQKGSGINIATFTLTAVAITIYILIMKPLGFCLASALFLFAEFYILSEPKNRNYLVFGIVAVVFSFAAYCIFRLGLNLMLPRGIMPF